jgi:hypothetical protein
VRPAIHPGVGVLAARQWERSTRVVCQQAGSLDRIYPLGDGGGGSVVSSARCGAGVCGMFLREAGGRLALRGEEVW